MKNQLHILILGLILFCILSLKGQNTTIFNTTNTSTTLCNNSVHTVVEDSAGIKWIGTSDGLSRYDGLNWTTYTTDDGLLSDAISSICIDSSGNIWLLSPIAISKFDGTNFTNYVNKDITNPKGMAVDSSNNIWVINLRNGVLKFDGANWTTYTVEDGLVDNLVESIAIDQNGIVWVGSVRGYSTFDGVNWTAHRSDLSNSQFPYLSIRSIYIDSDNNKWFGAYQAIGKLSGTNWTIFPTTITHGEEFCHVEEIKGDSDGNIWAGSQKYGVSRFDGTNWLNNTTEDGILRNHVQSMLIDKQDSVWLCFLNGISVGVINNWRSLRVNGLIDNSINCITEVSNDSKWIGTSGGLSIYNGSDWKNFYDSISDTRKIIYDNNNENLWLATSNGVFKHDGMRWSHYTTENCEINTNNIIDIAIDKNNSIWFLTNKGISLNNGDSWINYTPNIKGTLIEKSRNIEIDSNKHKWIITHNSITKFDDLTWTNYSSINNSIINKVAIDSIGKIWMSTNNGVYLKNYDSWIKYNIQNSRSVFVDKYENVWIGNNDSVYLYQNNTWFVLQKNDVLQGLNRFEAIIADNEKNIWIGGSRNGIAVLDSAYVSDSVISLDAISTTDMHIVDFIVNEGSSFKGVYSHGNSIRELTPPIKEGHEFSAWSKRADQIDEWNFETDVVVSSDTLYAHWSINTYEVKFAALFGGSIPEISAEYNSLISAPEIPSRTGYTFVAWYMESNHINEWNFAKDSVVQNITLYAKWAINSYTVKFKDEDGILLPDTSVNYNSLVTEPNEPTKSGKAFLNWYKESEGINHWNYLSDRVISDTVIYAKWLNINSSISNRDMPNLSVFPNPVNTTLHLKNAPADTEIAIYNFSGRLMLQTKMEEAENSVEVKDLPSGLYLIILNSSEGSFKGKFVKQ